MTAIPALSLMLLAGVVDVGKGCPLVPLWGVVDRGGCCCSCVLGHQAEEPGVMLVAQFRDAILALFLMLLAGVVDVGMGCPLASLWGVVDRGGCCCSHVLGHQAEEPGVMLVARFRVARVVMLVARFCVARVVVNGRTHRPSARGGGGGGGGGGRRSRGSRAVAAALTTPSRWTATPSPGRVGHGKSYTV